MVSQGYKQPSKQEGSTLLFKHPERDDVDKVLNKKDKESPLKNRGIIEVVINPEKEKGYSTTPDELNNSFSNEDEKSEGSQMYENKKKKSD